MLDSLKIASILDNRTHECLKYECNLIKLDRYTWKKQLIDNAPKLLIVESVLNSENENWGKEICNLRTKKISILKDVVKWCKNNKIATVFWNTQDPIHYGNFIEASKLFDYIFTIDSNCISKYKKNVGHQNVFLLPFAAQGKIHNPVEKDKKKLGRVAFVGPWYERISMERKKSMEMLLKPAFKYGVHVYDEKYNYKKSDKFPQIYSPYIQGSLSYDQIVEIYKKYNVFLNVNITQGSPTMLSRRIFELLACGTNIISEHLLGIEKTFPNVVKLCKTDQDVDQYLKIFLKKKVIRDRLSLVGQREVFNKHTYRHRLESILQKVGLNLSKRTLGVSVITCTNRQSCMEDVFKNFERQKYAVKELIIVLNNNKMSLPEWKDKAKHYKNIKIFQLDQRKSLGECLNYGVGKSKYEYVAKFDDDDYYAPQYLVDSINAFKYTNASIIGKRTCFVYFKGRKVLALKTPNQENKYFKNVSGATLVIKRNVFDKIKFDNITVGEDQKFLEKCATSGMKIYSIDRFNYVCTRHKSVDKHTWKIDEARLLDKCQVIKNTEDFIPHITV